MKNMVMKSIYRLISVIATFIFVTGYLLINDNLIVSATEKVEDTETTTAEGIGKSADSKLAIIEVSNYYLDEGILAAGKDISVILSLHNLSSKYDAESVMLEISSDSGMIYPSYGNDNCFFVGTIPADESVEITIPITVSSSFAQDYVDLKCKFSYVSKDAIVTNDSIMMITTSGGQRIIVNSIDVSTHAVVNGKSLINISFSNKSNANIDDAKLIVDGNVADESKEIDLGLINSGKNYTKDLNVTFTETGNQSINIRLAYTDGQGKFLETSLGNYNVSVSEEMISENQGNERFNSLLIWGGRVLAFVSLVIAAFVIILYIKKR